jgi:hypothetical protein
LTVCVCGTVQESDIAQRIASNGQFSVALRDRFFGLPEPQRAGWISRSTVLLVGAAPRTALAHVRVSVVPRSPASRHMSRRTRGRTSSRRTRWRRTRRNGVFASPRLESPLFELPELLYGSTARVGALSEVLCGSRAPLTLPSYSSRSGSARSTSASRSRGFRLPRRAARPSATRRVSQRHPERSASVESSPQVRRLYNQRQTQCRSADSRGWRFV